MTGILLKPCLPATLAVTSSPAYSIRGHQLGYRHHSNTYDAWDEARFDRYIRELALFYPQLMVISVNWFQAAPKTGIFDQPGDHADEMETSVMMHIAPNLLRPLAEAGDGAHKSFNLAGFREGWAWTQRPWSKVTKDTGSGNPMKATPEKGKAFLDQTINNIAAFFAGLANATVDDLLKD